MITGHIFTNKKNSSDRLSDYYIGEGSNNYDYEIDALESMVDLNNQYYSIMKEHLQITYLGIKENNSEILEEGFSDFLKGVKDFFVNIIKHITEFFKKAYTYILAYIGDFEKFLQKNKDLITAAKPDFNIGGYEYTFDGNVPNTSRIETIISEFNSDVRELSSMKMADVTKLREKYNTEAVEKIRAEVLGVTGGISYSDFMEEVKKRFRNGESEEKDIHIDSSKLNHIVDNYPNMSKLLKETQKDRDKTLKILNDMKTFFERNASVRYEGNAKKIHTSTISADNDTFKKVEGVSYKYSDDAIKIANNYFNFRFQQSKELSTILSNVFQEKVKALRECLTFYRQAVRSSIFSKKEKAGDK